MIGGRLSRAGRTRLARVARGGGASVDAGFALVLVMMVTTLIMTSVAATVAVTAPNIVGAKRDLDGQAAYAAAEAGIDDVVAYLTSVTNCRSTTRVCTEALGTNSTALHRPQLAGTNQSFSWNTDPTVTVPDGYVRVHSTGTVLGSSRTLIADIALAPSILSFGYYTDYESQSPSFLYKYFAGRTVALTNSTTYAKVNAYDNNGRTLSVPSPTNVTWDGPATRGTNPNPAQMCGEHWYSDSATSPGRSSFSPSSVWGENGHVSSSSLTRVSSCDVVFTTGMTFDGPIYTRDAMLISDATVGGIGPIFNKPVSSLWGFAGKNSPAVPAQPWRKDASSGGNISASSPYSPATATLDLQLPTDIGTTGLPDNVCVYFGPTRVKLNGNGTATVTSPQTTTRNPASDPNCYPSGSLAGGIVNFTLRYQTAGNGALYVKDLGTKPGTGWPGTGIKSTAPASTANSVFYLPATGGAVTPDQADASAAVTTSCSSTVKYASTSSWPCAWTNVATTTDVGTGSGWTAFTTTAKCNSGIAASNRQLFECEYSHNTGATTPVGDNYGTLRSAVQTQLATGSCVPGTGSTQATCLSTIVNNALQTANTGQHAYNYASPANADHRYLVTSTSVGSTTTGTAQSVGSAPTPPMSSDPMFSATSTAAKETASKTPVTLTVSRQTYGCINASGTIIGSIVTLLSGLLGCLTGNPGWGNTTPQFTLTSTQSAWSITSPASGASYFPNTNDVTQYSRGTAGTAGADGPGDLYIDGDNQGKLSLIAQGDVIVTGDVRDTSAVAANDAVDIVAGQNVRNYHPVSCVDQTAADINATTAGTCPNDITGLYRGVLETNGVLSSSHPAMQYTNINPVGARRIDAAVFALSGSFLTDNYNRGNPIGTLTVNGGLYQSNRGANGVQWEFLASDTSRATSGYSLQYHYVDLQHSGLPYAPPATGGSNTRVWNVVSVSAGAS